MSTLAATLPLCGWSPVAERLRQGTWNPGMNVSDSSPMRVHSLYAETSNFGRVRVLVYDYSKIVNLDSEYEEVQVSNRAIDRWKPQYNDFAVIYNPPFVLNLIGNEIVPTYEYLRDSSDKQTAQDYFTRTPDHARIMEFSDSLSQANANRQKYTDRIETLRALGKEDGIELNPESKQDFLSFVDSIPTILKGDLILLDNGDLRAIWDDEYGAHIGLQFQGTGEVQYVIFSRRLSTGKKWRGCGNGDFDLVKRQIATYDLWSVLSEQG